MILQPGTPRRMRVGRAERCELRIDRPRLAEEQFEVAWDGRALWARDRLGLARTFVGGVPLAGWTCVRGHQLIRMPGAALWASGPPGDPRRSAPVLDGLRRQQERSERHRCTARMTVPAQVSERFRRSMGE